MKCPFCSHDDSRVIDTRQVGDRIRRRRECEDCEQRFTTYERIAPIKLMVVKENGRREQFDRDKLLVGVQKACAKRPVSMQEIEDLVDEVENAVYNMGQAEVASRQIGEMVMDRLQVLDDVAYVRFASVYRQFTDVDRLAEEIEKLKERKEREEQLKRQYQMEL